MEVKQQKLIRWKLSEVMARYRITGKALAEELNVRQESISNWKTNETMPRINGEKVQLLVFALSKLSGQAIRFSDLYEENYELINQQNARDFNQPMSAA